MGVLMAVLLVFVVSATQARSSKHCDVCSVKAPPKANGNMCHRMQDISLSFFPRKFLLLCDKPSLRLKYCLPLPTLALVPFQWSKLSPEVCEGLQPGFGRPSIAKHCQGKVLLFKKFNCQRSEWVEEEERLLSKTFSVFKSAKQIGLKGLLAGVEKALGLRASVGG